MQNGAGMDMEIRVLRGGQCEPLKAGVHATALGLFVVMGAYNGAAWLLRREGHLALNAVVYGALIVWEQHHIAHHLAAIRRCQESGHVATDDPVVTTLAA